MPGKRLSAIFSDLDFSFLGCGNPVRSPDDEKYLKHCNAPVKRLKEPFTSQLKKQCEDESESCHGKSAKERPLSRDELMFELELIQNNLKVLDVDTSLMDDIVQELNAVNPDNTLLKKSISMPTLCISEEASTTTTTVAMTSITKSMSMANTRKVIENPMMQRTR